MSPAAAPGLRPAFITSLATFLPNAPVGNDAIESVLGALEGIPSRTRAVILRNNGIRSRHYALDPATGRQTHTNAQLTAEAVRALAAKAGIPLSRIDLVACGTSSPDQLMPGHALMVVGELGLPPCEAMTAAGVCASGMAALKYAALSVGAGLSRAAVATGSETASSVLRAGHFEPVRPEKLEALEKNALLGLDQEFLRWMLSDGAGAVLVAPEPRGAGLSLRIEWIEIITYAGEAETCMYWGARKLEDGSLQGWREAGREGSQEAGRVRRAAMNVSQDVRLLGREVGERCITRAFDLVRRRHPIRAGEVDWFLPHYSSEYFRGEVRDRFAKMDFAIPEERWFTNLTTKGNTGSASVFLMLDELMDSGRLKAGERILCFVPESARFTAAYALLSVTSPHPGRTP